MERSAVELEVVVPCVEGQEPHPVRIAVSRWSEWQIVSNPCAEAIGEAFSAMAPCSHAIYHPDVSLRRTVAQLLTIHGGEAAVKPLIDALDDEDAQVRLIAAAALGAWGVGTAATRLTQLLRDEDLLVRSAAADALTLLGIDGVYALLSELDSPEAQYRDLAAQLLGRLRDAYAEPALRLYALVSDDAAIALGHIGTSELSLEDAARALAERAHWQPILNTLHCEGVSPVIGALGAQATGLIPLLCEVVRDSSASKSARAHAADALGRLGALALEPLMHLLRERDAQTRTLACAALGQSGCAEAIPLLQLYAPSVETARAALATQNQHLSLEEAARATLAANRLELAYFALLGDGVAEALGKLGAPARDLLLRALQDEDARIRVAACHALAALNDPTTAASLQERLQQDSASEVRAAAWCALAQLVPDETLPLLHRALQTPATRQAAVDTTALYGARTLPFLMPALSDPDAAVRAAACHALGRTQAAQARPCCCMP